MLVRTHYWRGRGLPADGSGHLLNLLPGRHAPAGRSVSHVALEHIKNTGVESVEARNATGGTKKCWTGGTSARSAAAITEVVRDEVDSAGRNPAPFAFPGNRQNGVKWSETPCLFRQTNAVKAYPAN